MALAAGLAGCASGPTEQPGSAAACEPADGPVELSYWTNGVSGMEDVVGQWNDENPDIQVSVSTFDDYPTLTNALAAGEAPDIAQIEYSRVTNFRAQNSLLDVSACLEELAPDAGEQYVDWTWAQATGNGEGVFGVPQDIGPMALYYNQSLFDEFGIEVPTTWEQFRTAAEQFREHDVHIAHFDPTSAGLFNGYLWQNHANMYSYSDAGWSVDVDNSEALDVADYWQGLIDDGLVRTDLVNFSTPLSEAWASEDVATSLSAAWGYVAAPAANAPGDWRVAPMPVWNEAEPSSSNWGGSIVAFMQGSEHPYEALKFLLWLNGDLDAVEQTFELGGLFPAAIEGQQLDGLQGGSELYGGQEIFEVFFESAGLVDTDFMWGPTQDSVDAALTDALSAAVNGDGTIADALASAQEAALETMEAQGLPLAD